jgi:hypothetical protein
MERLKVYKMYLCVTILKAHKDAVDEAGKVEEDNKVYHHFISFVWKAGKVIELDGRKSAPIVYGECD